MANFITTIQFTEQGIKSIKDSPKRATAFKAAAKKLGVKVTSLYWTLGPFDGCLICDAPDEARTFRMAAFRLSPKSVPTKNRISLHALPMTRSVAQSVRYAEAT